MSEEGAVTLKDKVQELLDSAINPAVAGHGGYIELIDVKDSTVYIRMSGGCQGCGAADVTLKAGIERMIFEEVPEVTESVPTAVLVVRRVVVSALVGTLLGLIGSLLLVRLTDWPRSMLA